MKLGIALARLIVGGLFLGHGLQKLAGWFGGYGLEATGNAFESMDLRPGKLNAAAAGASEAGGGAMLAAGFLTPLAGSLLSGTMITAIRKVHAPKGLWVAEGGYEYNLVMLAAVFAIVDVGPGALSLDEALGLRLEGPGWAIAQLAAGAIGSTLVISMGARRPAADAATQPAQEGVAEPAHNGQGAPTM
jgi:putative oxidoreductase